MSESLQKLYEDGMLPKKAYYMNRKIRFRIESPGGRMLVDLRKPLNKKKSIWLPVDEVMDALYDPAFQTKKEHKEAKWVRELDSMGQTH